MKYDSLATTTETKGLQVRPTFYNHRWTKPVVYVFDGTGHSEWDVAGAISEWNSSRATLTLQATNDQLTADIVLVEEYSGGHVGLSNYTTEAGGTVITHCFIQLDPMFRTMGNVAKTATRHELGHAFGLYHNTAFKRGSAMNAVTSSATAISRLGSWDLANLATIYPA